MRTLMQELIDASALIAYRPGKENKLFTKNGSINTVNQEDNQIKTFCSRTVLFVLFSYDFTILRDSFESRKSVKI